MNTLNGLTVKILTRAAQVFAWPAIICGINPGGTPAPLNVDASGNVIMTPGGPLEFAKLSGTIAAPGVSQPASTAKTRNKLVIQNPGTATESLFIDFTGPATTASFEIQPGQTQVFTAPTDNRELSIMATDAGHAYTIWEA